jgi:hypothetical protein
VGSRGNIIQQLKSTAVAAELIDNKKMFIIACKPSMTDPDTTVVNLQNPIKEYVSEDRSKEKTLPSSFYFYSVFVVVFLILMELFFLSIFTLVSRTY